MRLQSILFALFLSSSYIVFGADLNDDELLGIRSYNSRTYVDRITLFNDSQFVFDFNPYINSTQEEIGLEIGNGGRIISAIPSNYPAMIGHGISMTLGIIEPCGLNLPHTHPRATEMNYIISGSFSAGFFFEDGERFIGNNLTAGMITIFPKGSIHFEQNKDCEPAMFLAAFTTEDPGVQSISKNYFGLPVEVTSADMNTDAENIQKLPIQLAKDPALGVEECRRVCGLPPIASSAVLVNPWTLTMLFAFILMS